MPKDKILIVDDEDLIRWSLRKKISNWGYQVLEAANAKAAVETAEKESPELILLDIRLPDMSGLEVLRTIEARKLLAPAGTLITHTPREELPPERIGALELSDRRSYGRAVVSFYRWAAPSAGTSAP